MTGETSWSEEQRIALVLHKALDDAKCQSRSLTGKDRQALQMEWLEFSALEWDELEISWIEHFQEWGK